MMPLRPTVATRTVAVVVLVILCVPIVMILWASFLNDQYIRFPPASGYTAQWYAHFWAARDLGAATLTSLRVGAIATAISMVIGLLASLALGRIGSKRAQGVFDIFFLLPLLVPSIVSAPALYATTFLLGSYTGLSFLSSDVVLIGGHVMITVPWTYRLISVGLSGNLRVLERASLSLGRRRLGTTMRITLPMLRSHIFGAGLFAFIFSFVNLEISLFLTRAGEVTLPVALMQYAFFKVDPTLAAASVVQMALVAVLMLVAVRLVGYGSVVRR